MSKWINETRQKDGLTALHYATWIGNIKIIKELIKNGANIHAVNSNGIGIMHIAAQSDQASMLVYFKELGLSPSCTDKQNATPLHWACYFCSENAVAYLLAWTKKLNQKDSKGNTPLHLAARGSMGTGNVRPMKLMLISGAQRHIKV